MDPKADVCMNYVYHFGAPDRYQTPQQPRPCWAVHLWKLGPGTVPGILQALNRYILSNRIKNFTLDALFRA